MKLEHVSAVTARRLLLAGQGLLADPRPRVTPRLLLERVRALGLVQVDSINVVARAHDLTLATRLDGYRPGMLAPLLEETRGLFEHWTHDASILPSEWYPHWHHRFARDRRRVYANAWWRSRLGARPEAVAGRLLKRIEREGPLGASDLETSRRGEGTWWEWSPQKAALEYLWRTGRVAVTRRVNFQKVYDLTGRVLPRHASLPPSGREEHLDWALGEALERLGVATPTELAAYFRAVTPAEAKRWCARRLAAKELVEVMVEAEGAGAPRRAVARPDWRSRAAALPEPPEGARLLSPFDPIVRDRARALRLFGFDYRFEAFTPAPKRRHGYYVLPLLLGDRLVGRVDLKHDRDAGVLRVQGHWWERGAGPARVRKRALDEAVARLARQLGASL